MAEHERWQVSSDAAVVYENCFVPAIFGSWAEPVADAAGIRGGDAVLDVGCGSGVLAREALRRGGRVTGVDINEGMLAVAAKTEPAIEWRTGDAGALPFGDAAFDVVVSQFVLMFVPDRAAAVREMWRVLAPGGRLAVAVWASLEKAPGFRILRDIAGPVCGPRAAGLLAAPFVLGDREELAGLFGDIPAAITPRAGTMRFPSAREWVRVQVAGTPLAGVVSDAEARELAERAEEALAGYVTPSGELVMPVEAYIVTATR